VGGDSPQGWGLMGFYESSSPQPVFLNDISLKNNYNYEKIENKNCTPYTYPTRQCISIVRP
jgi:hypothetical protein